MKQLDCQKVKYEKKTLKVEDFAWIWIANDIKTEIPYLIERNRIGWYILLSKDFRGELMRQCLKVIFSIYTHILLADDLARSMIDGRYTSQKERMVAMSKNFQYSGVQPRVMYLIEGNTKQLDGKCGLPKAADVEASLYIEWLKLLWNVIHLYLNPKFYKWININEQNIFTTYQKLPFTFPNAISLILKKYHFI